MKRIIGTILLILMVVGIFAPISEAALSGNKRRAVVLEAFYALRQSHDGGCDKTITTPSGTWCVSNWNYLNNDWGAYNVVMGWYGCAYSSVWRVSGDSVNGTSCVNTNAQASFFSNPGSYGYGTFGGSNGSVGRGGQCRYFSNLILYRSGSHQSALPAYPTNITSNPDYETNMQNAIEGDILVTLNEGSGYNITHTAIVVEIKRSGTTVTGLDVIDANWISDNGQSGREVIGRHLLSVSYLQQHSYGIWKKISYYGTQYDPNAP